MKFVYFSTVYLLSLFGTASALRCYTNITNGFNSVISGSATDCIALSPFNNGQTQPSFSCLKITDMTVNTNYRICSAYNCSQLILSTRTNVVNQCYNDTYANMLASENIIQQQIQGLGITNYQAPVTFCCCSGDGCNPANRIKISILAIFIAFLICFYRRR